VDSFFAFSFLTGASFNFFSSKALAQSPSLDGKEIQGYLIK